MLVDLKKRLFLKCICFANYVSLFPQGIELMTGMSPTNEDINYFRIHLNQNNTVETIVCLTKKVCLFENININCSDFMGLFNFNFKVLNVTKYTAMWGMHEALLGNLRTRFEKHAIQNLYDFFNMPWVYLLTHDSFADKLRRKNDEICKEMLHLDAPMFAEIRDNVIANKWLKVCSYVKDSADNINKTSSFFFFFAVE